MNKTVKRAGLALAGAAAVVSTTAVSDADALQRQIISVSIHSDRDVKVAKSFAGGGDKVVVKKGKRSPFVKTYSYYLPEGCDSKIATTSGSVFRQDRATGWRNLGSLYQVGHWRIELWCPKPTGGGGSWSVEE